MYLIDAAAVNQLTHLGSGSMRWGHYPHLIGCKAPAGELAGAYTRRWGVETAFDALETHPRGPRRAVITVTDWSPERSGDTSAATTPAATTPSGPPCSTLPRTPAMTPTRVSFVNVKTSGTSVKRR